MMHLHFNQMKFRLFRVKLQYNLTAQISASGRREGRMFVRNPQTYNFDIIRLI